jgi:hypothetical protein
MNINFKLVIMRTLKITLIIAIGLLLTNCSNPTQSKYILKHTILKNEVHDVPIKTQVQLDVLISDTAITKEKVSDLLTFLYDKTSKRTGFKHHTNPTNIYIYAYTSKEKAESGMAQWVGMISKSYDDTQPKIDISETQLNSLTLKPIEKFGLSEKVRLEIWNKSIKIEDKAQKEADLKYPLDKAGITQDDIKKNGALNNKLKEKYEKELAEEYNITVAIIDSIGVEGLTKGWPFPKY